MAEETAYETSHLISDIEMAEETKDAAQDILTDTYEGNRDDILMSVHPPIETPADKL